MANLFYRDDAGDPRARTGRERRLLGRFLESDIQGSRTLCDEALAALDDLAAGRRRCWRMTGNAHTLTAFRRKSRIQAEVGRGAGLVLPTSELRLALLEWRLLLGKRPPRRRN
jgi:hypothetical protein